MLYNSFFGLALTSDRLKSQGLPSGSIDGVPMSLWLYNSLGTLIEYWTRKRRLVITGIEDSGS